MIYMLPPSKLILLAQVYICLVNASSVFFDNLDHGGEFNEIDTDPYGASREAGGPFGDPTSHVRAAIASKVLPEVRANNRFGSLGLYGGHKENQILLEPLALNLHNNLPSYQRQNDSSESSLLSNSIDSPSMSSIDFEAYSITISPALMLSANDKDQEELEEKFEMHTNNHHSSANNIQPSLVVSGKNSHNTRHYNNYPPTKHQLHYLPSALGKYPTTSFSNSNNNLNYIHNLLLTKPSSQVSALSNLLHGQSSTSSSYQHSSSASLVPPASPHQQPYTTTRLEQTGQQQNVTLLDLSGDGRGATVCGRQQVAAGSSREPRIVGGNNTYEGEFPWAVSIQRHGNHHCGGVIVGRRWILTAAHCVRSQLVGNLNVRTGGNTLARSANHISSHLERDYLVDQIVMHGDFSRYDNLTASQMKSSANTNNADIALLRLKQEIHWNELAWPVCFPAREAGNFSGHDAVVIGWGKLNEKSEEFSNELQKVKLTIIDNKVCQNWFRQAGREMPIDDRVICAGFKNGGKDACHGDSGGPLLIKINGHYAVVGVVSTGIGCARPLLPGLYSRVSSYIGWIERNIT